MLRVDGLSKRLEHFDLHDVSFEVGTGEYFVLLGASGVGKTVLLETIAGVTPCDAGCISWEDDEITHTRSAKRGLGMVYQDHALFPHMNVFHNIAYGLRARRWDRAAIYLRVRALAQDVGVSHLLDRRPDTLSGGEAQRVALARALATEPRCLLLDEPMASLDGHAQMELRALLRSRHRQGQTVLHVTHDYEEAVSLATRIGIMENGTVVQAGSPDEVFHHPKSEFVVRFIGIRNVFKGILRRAQSEVAQFAAGNLRFSVLTDALAGPGMVLVRSEDVTVARERADTSAQNCFRGIITDIAPARMGVEVTVNIGVEIAALITGASLDRLALRCGQEVWVSFKAAAARFVEE